MHGERPPHQTEDGRSWHPWPGRRWCYTGGAIVALLAAIRSEGGPLGLGGGIAFTVVAAVLAVLAVLDLWYGTPLTVDADGLRLRRGPGRVRTIAWTEIDRIESTTSTSRGLLRLSSLEVDVGDQLIVLSRHRLGADPDQVADELRRRRPGSAPQPPP